MSVWAEIWAYDQTLKNSGRKFTLVSLASFADENGFCYPSQETLAAMTEQGVSTVREHLKALTKAGLIRREHRYSKKGKGRTSDGFYLQGPVEAFRPNRAVKGKSLPPDKPAPTARTGDFLPPDSGGDLSGKDDLSNEPSENQRAALRAGREKDKRRMMVFLSQGIRGPIPAPNAQAAAVNWLLESGYTLEECEACLTWLREQKWRTTAVTWCTVKSEIGNYVTRNDKHGRQKQTERADGATRGYGGDTDKSVLRKGINER